MVFIECRSLIKIYHIDDFIHVPALKEINLSILPNTLNAIMGPSGSGKSTLMNILGGKEKISAGYVRVGDFLLSEMKNSELEQFRKNEVGFVNQLPENNLISSISALKNVQIPMMIRNIPRETRKKKIFELLEVVGLKDRIYHTAKTLSGGESQRLSIAIALANDPILLIADEPTGELDSETTKKIIELFKDLNKEHGKAIIVATHDKRLALHCDTYRLGNGRIISSVLGFSGKYQSKLFDDELLVIDKYGTISLPEEQMARLGHLKFVKITFNSTKNCLEIYSPNKLNKAN